MSGTCLDMSNVKLIHLGSFWIKAGWKATRDRFQLGLESTRCVSSLPSTERASPHHTTPWLRPNPWHWWQLPRRWQQSGPLTLSDSGLGTMPGHLLYHTPCWLGASDWSAVAEGVWVLQYVLISFQHVQWEWSSQHSGAFHCACLSEALCLCK